MALFVVKATLSLADMLSALLRVCRGVPLSGR